MQERERWGAGAERETDRQTNRQTETERETPREREGERRKSYFFHKDPIGCISITASYMSQHELDWLLTNLRARDKDTTKDKRYHKTGYQPPS